MAISDINSRIHLYIFTNTYLPLKLIIFRRAFKNIYQILKPGGWTFLNIFERSPLDEVFEKLSKNPKWSDYGQDEIISKYYYSENPQNEYRRDIDAANFKDYHFNVEKDIYNFESIEEFNS